MASETCADGERWLGRPGEDVEVIAFRGGAAKTVMYLGVAQAWILLDRKPPALATGISAGAIAAVAMAEVLQAEVAPGADPRQAQAERLRELLLASADAPRELLRAWVPDAYEINAEYPLKSLELPTQFKRERADRETATHSKFGLIRLFNDVLDIDLRISVITQVVRHILELIALGDEPSPWKRLIGKIRTVAALWFLGCSHAAGMSLLLLTMGTRWTSGAETRRGRTTGQLLSIARRYSVAAVKVAWRALAFGVFLLFWVLPPLFAIGALLAWIMRAPLSRVIWLSVLPAAELALAAAWYVLRRVSPPTKDRRSRFWDRLLRGYDLHQELGSSYDLEQFLAALFDPDYYGTLDFAGAIERALKRDRTPQPDNANRPRKTLACYERRARPMRVAPAVADLATGDLRLLGRDVGVVESLLAASAAVPFFRARTLQTGNDRDRDHTFIDGIVVANEPISALMDYLRRHLNPKVGEVRIYAGSTFPTSGPAQPVEQRYTDLVDVVDRVLQIERVQSATLERELTEVYSQLLPGPMTLLSKPDGTLRPFVQATIVPIDAEQPLEVNSAILGARTQAERARVIYASAACGCRATLATLLKDDIRMVAGGRRVVRCAEVLSAHNCGRQPPVSGLPGSDCRIGPGLPEVCAECRVTLDERGTRFEYPQSILVPPSRDEKKPAADPPGAPQEPWVSMALSGGVFRGVFQLGVLNAISELGITPRLYAGSSVGAIMAALGARLTTTDSIQDRRALMREIAATFLALDYVIPTDRFTDFVRRSTLRAASADFSIRDADLLFRRYDFSSASEFSELARRVIAGLERLVYLTPFELRALVEAIREEDLNAAVALLKRYVQDFLERSGVGLELLGAEPLECLIYEYVLAHDPNSPSPACATLDAFNDTYLVVTSTDLNEGMLRELGLDAARGRADSDAAHVRLVQALLASSAFPSVFRPRTFGQVKPQAARQHQLVDGGVTDNLPLHAVTTFLTRASDSGLTVRRPCAGRIPHLLLTASLEPKWAKLDPTEARRLATSWQQVRRRARQLRFNRKVDSFARAQRNLRFIWQHVGNGSQSPPVDLEVITVKPDWLCDTFGFHPMLGFRRQKQARSIAHGCAATFAKLAHLPELGQHWSTQDWGFDISDIDPATVAWAPQREGDDLHPAEREPLLQPAPHDRRHRMANGTCWFRKTAVCPFSRVSQGLGPGQTSGTVVESLHAIYLACGDPRTHRPH